MAYSTETYKCLSQDVFGKNQQVEDLHQIISTAWGIKTTRAPCKIKPFLFVGKSKILIHTRIEDVDLNEQSQSRVLNLRCSEIKSLVENFEEIVKKNNSKKERRQDFYNIITRGRACDIRLKYSAEHEYVDIRLWVIHNGRYTPTKRGFRVSFSECSNVLSTLKEVDTYLGEWALEIPATIELVYKSLWKICLDYFNTYCQNQLGWYGEDCDAETFDEGSRFIQVVDGYSQDSFIDIYEEIINREVKKKKPCEIVYGYKLYPYSAYKYCLSSPDISAYFASLYRGGSGSVDDSSYED